MEGRANVALFQRILHPTDFSSASLAAFERAIELAEHHGADLLLLHVVDDPFLVETSGLKRDAATRIERQLHELRQRCRCGCEALAIEIGPPAETIVWYAWQQKCDLIVMGTHGRTGMTHAYLGSIAERVIRRAMCPVFVVRPVAPDEPPPEKPELTYAPPRMFI